MNDTIMREAREAIEELLEISKPRVNELIVIGCSTSEIIGEAIGKAGSEEVAQMALDGIMPPLGERGLYLAAQCCEHLNRALIIEREAAERFGYEIVSVRPRPNAGGSFATAAYERMSDPVAVERIKAVAGLDIGATLIGMHLRDVAVPVRLRTKTIGSAILIAARTRPKLIGGVRAEYPEEN